MPPRDFFAVLKARTEQRKQDRQFQDQLQAHQTARILNVLCGTEERPAPYQPGDCMAFVWGDTRQDIKTPEEMTDDMIEEFDRRMDSWEIVTREANRHG
jgi:hypothetical protein